MLLASPVFGIKGSSVRAHVFRTSCDVRRTLRGLRIAKSHVPAGPRRVVAAPARRRHVWTSRLDVTSRRRVQTSRLDVTSGRHNPVVDRPLWEDTPLRKLS